MGSTPAQLLADLPRRVCCGHSSFSIFEPAEVDHGQVGYSVDGDRCDLCGTEDGEWRREWVVIGYEGMCGDPIFVDTSKAEYPFIPLGMGRGDGTRSRSPHPRKG